MRIGIVGYGRMGKEVERLASVQGFEVVWILDEEENRAGAGLTDELVRRADVCIEFTTPNAASKNVERVLMHGGKIVCGTTGWHAGLSVAESSAKPGSALVYGNNFSIGANLFGVVIAEAARVFGRFEAYDVAIHELHHTGKVDHPSGTARTLADMICENVPRKAHWMSEIPSGAIQEEILHVSFTRVGKTPGRHTVYFDSEDDTVEIQHTARGRSGFARGALLAARWIADREGVFSFQQLLTSLVDRRNS